MLRTAWGGPSGSIEVGHFKASKSPLQIRWYGLMYGLSFIIGYYLIRHLAPKRGVPLYSDGVAGLILYLVAGVMVGGRLGYVIFYNSPYYLHHPAAIVAVWDGGNKMRRTRLFTEVTGCLCAGTLGVAIALCGLSSRVMAGAAPPPGVSSDQSVVQSTIIPPAPPAGFNAFDLLWALTPDEGVLPSYRFRVHGGITVGVNWAIYRTGAQEEAIH
jgi:Prolipoprotein diacylglyceryl transferase